MPTIFRTRIRNNAAKEYFVQPLLPHRKLVILIKYLEVDLTRTVFKNKLIQN